MHRKLAKRIGLLTHERKHWRWHHVGKGGIITCGFLAFWCLDLCGSKSWWGVISWLVAQSLLVQAWWLLCLLNKLLLQDLSHTPCACHSWGGRFGWRRQPFTGFATFKIQPEHPRKLLFSISPCESPLRVSTSFASASIDGSRSAQKGSEAVGQPFPFASTRLRGLHGRQATSLSGRAEQAFLRRRLQPWGCRASELLSLLYSWLLIADLLSSIGCFARIGLLRFCGGSAAQQHISKFNNMYILDLIRCPRPQILKRLVKILLCVVLHCYCIGRKSFRKDTSIARMSNLHEWHGLMPTSISKLVHDSNSLSSHLLPKSRNRVAIRILTCKCCAPKAASTDRNVWRHVSRLAASIAASILICSSPAFCDSEVILDPSYPLVIPLRFSQVQSLIPGLLACQLVRRRSDMTGYSKFQRKVNHSWSSHGNYCLSQGDQDLRSNSVCFPHFRRHNGTLCIILLRRPAQQTHQAWKLSTIKQRISG